MNAPTHLAERRLWNTSMGPRPLHSPELLWRGIWRTLLAMEVPDVHHARNGEVALAYQVLGKGPVDLVFVPQWIGNLELTSDNPL